jgi:glutathione S-transferase
MEAVMRLYEFGPTRSIRARWTLQELGVGFEPITVNLVAGDHRRPEFLKINPAGKIPVLVDGDVVLTESVAIVVYLAEKYPEKGFLPADLGERAQVNRWLLFAATSWSSRSGGYRGIRASTPRTSGSPATSRSRGRSSRRWPPSSRSTCGGGSSSWAIGRPWRIS